VSATEVVTALLVGLGLLVELLAALGVLAFGDVFDRLHFTSPAAFGGVLVCAGVLVHESFSIIGLKAILLAAFLLFTGPVLVHTTARSLRISRHGDWRIREGERVRVEGR
jgi:multicomponent Na+:H+ antiporter subunit G